MKNLILILLFPVLASCSDIYIDDIDVDYTTTTLVPGQDLIPISLSDLGFNEFTQFDINASDTFKEKVGSTSKITFINLQTFELSTVDPVQHLDFLNSVSFYIAIEDGPEQLLAYADSFPLNSNRIFLNVERELDLTPYIKSDDITIRAEVQGNQPTSDTQIRASLVFLVDTTHPAFF